MADMDARGGRASISYPGPRHGAERLVERGLATSHPLNMGDVEYTMTPLGRKALALNRHGIASSEVNTVEPHKHDDGVWYVKVSCTGDPALMMPVDTATKLAADPRAAGDFDLADKYRTKLIGPGALPVAGSKSAVTEVEKNDPLEARKRLTFKQAEGIDPLPTQLQRGQISQQFRAVLWALLHAELLRHRYSFEDEYLPEPWDTILRDAHVHYDHKPVDEFPRRYFNLELSLKHLVLGGAWHDVLGWLEYVLRHTTCPGDFYSDVRDVMARCRLGYRVFPGGIIAPFGSEAEVGVINQAFNDLAASEMNGARAHLSKASKELAAGHYADSVRESIHAVEATARVLAPYGK